jgi:hypothetical protein
MRPDGSARAAEGARRFSDSGQRFLAAEDLSAGLPFLPENDKMKQASKAHFGEEPLRGSLVYRAFSNE